MTAVMSCSQKVDDIGEIADENPPEAANLGGGMTWDIAGGNAFITKAPNLTGFHFNEFLSGNSLFRRNFVPPPSTFYYGLGPLYYNSSCNSCHIAGGRGRPINAGEPAESIMMRISMPGTGTNNLPVPVPGFGHFFQPRSTAGVAPEGNIVVMYQDVLGKYDDGEQYRLRFPTYSVTRPYTTFPAAAMRSVRIASQLVGIGLLETIPDSQILANVDEADADGDGISGRANYVYDYNSVSTKLGRFGWKASVANLRQQAGMDMNEGMGVTSSAIPWNVENCIGQPQANGQTLDDPETRDADVLRPLVIFLKTTAVPKRRNMNDNVIRRGQKLFVDAGCNKCHLDRSFTTGVDKTDEIDVVANQKIYPYTDLLLHDMGEGLADNRPEFLADGREWRTPPLWGIGLTQLVSGNTYFLHDGRARSFSEAILWHGGEAETAKEFFRKLPKKDRDALIAFLNSL
jgi:CxxC motif-containing protein (DUF1111 family)